MANTIDTPSGPIHLTPGSCVGLAIPAGWLPPKAAQSQDGRWWVQTGPKSYREVTP